MATLGGRALSQRDLADLVVLAALIPAPALTRNHDRADPTTLGSLVVAFLARLLVRDLRKHPASFPEPRLPRASV